MENTNPNDIINNNRLRSERNLYQNYKLAENTLKCRIFCSNSNPCSRESVLIDHKRRNPNEKFVRLKKKEKIQIEQENSRINKSIENIKSSLSAQKLIIEYKKTRDYIRFSSKPKKLSKTIRSNSRQETQRPLIDVLNSYFLCLN